MGKHCKQSNKKVSVLSMLRIVFIIIALIAIVYIAKWYMDREQNKMLENKVSEAIRVQNVENGENIDIKYTVDFKKLKEINKDSIAWLKVNNTNIEYAVVKSNNNSYYLNHNFENKSNIGGWIFADYHNKLDGTDRNIVIYGHNMKDGSMFGTLENILKQEWYNNEENRHITFITENEQITYEVFSVYKIENEDYYINTQFTDEEFGSFIKTIKERSIKDFDVELTKNNSILTLSTCADNNKYRVVLHAKKMENTPK